MSRPWEEFPPAEHQYREPVAPGIGDHHRHINLDPICPLGVIIADHDKSALSDPLLTAPNEIILAQGSSELSEGGGWIENDKAKLI